MSFCRLSIVVTSLKVSFFYPDLTVSNNRVFLDKTVFSSLLHLLAESDPPVGQLEVEEDVVLVVEPLPHPSGDDVSGRARFSVRNTQDISV